MPNNSQSHTGSGDNVGGNKILNLSIPKILVLALILILGVVSFIYWRSVKEKYLFNKEEINVAVNVIDSLQIRGLNESEADFYKVEEVVYYDMKLNNDTFNISPSSAYFTKFLKNEAIGEEVNLYSLVPKINFKVTNNSNKTIFFSKMVLNVASSKTDPTPIPVFFTDECYQGFGSDNFYKTFRLPVPNENSIDKKNEVLPIAIYNEGWSPMKNVKLSFNIDAGAPNDSPEFNSLPFTFTIQQIDKESYLDIFPYLKKQGVDVERIIAVSASKTQDYFADEMLMANGLGNYAGYVDKENGQLNVFIYGYISYEDKNGKNYKNKFSTTVNILRQWGCGAAGLENGDYEISLCADGADYEITYPVSNYIKTGEVDNFSIRLTSPKSSIHKIGIKLFYADDKYIQKYINYHLIVPRRMVEDEVIKFKGNGKCENKTAMQE